MMQTILLRGFTLIEAMVYMALVSVLMLGVIGASMPVMNGAAHMNARITAEHESAFVARRILSLIPLAREGVLPLRGETTSMLVLTTYTMYGGESTYTFFIEDGALMSSITNGSTSMPPQPMSSSRVRFDSFRVTRNIPTIEAPEYIEVSYEVDGTEYGPYRRYFTL